MTDSPFKAPIFNTTENKENTSNVAIPIKGIPDMPEETKEVKPSVAVTIKAEEASEPLLQENPQRFVLFPIQNHDVSFSGRVPDASSGLDYQLTNFFIDLAHVQEGNGLILDCRRDRSLQRCPRLEQPPQRRRALLHLPHSCILRSVGRHCQREPTRALQQRSPGPRSPMLLRFPNRHGEHPLRDILPLDRDVDQRTQATHIPLQRY